MDKPFKTYNQQLKILRSRGMEIKNGSKAISVLKRENYYNIINGYKEIFLDSNSESSEKFKSGTKFEHIYSLFEFDRNLKGIFLKYILKLESSMKSKISYYFSEEYKMPFNYLNTNNFKDTELNEVTKLIARISSKIEKNTNAGQISHYLNNYKNLPLWVLMKKLDFGGMAFFYNSLKDDIKIKICEEIFKEYAKEYRIKTTIYQDYIQLGKMLFFVNCFRNVCAHDERLYNLKVNKKKIKFQHFFFLNVNNQYKLFDLLIILKIFLTKKDFKKLFSSVKEEFEDLKEILPNNLFNLVQIHMGFPKDWETLIFSF